MVGVGCPVPPVSPPPSPCVSSERVFAGGFSGLYSTGEENE